MLNASVQQIKGVGEKLAEDLQMLHIETIEDLLFYFPYRYDVFEVKPISELIHGDKVTIEGTVVYDPSLTFFSRNKSRLMFNVEVEGISIKAVMFNRAFAKKHLNAGDVVTLTGKWDSNRLQITVNTYKKGRYDQDAAIHPIYSIKGDITSNVLKKTIKNALKVYEKEVSELLPASYLQNYKLPVRHEALKTMHFPESRFKLKHARRRFVYEEFLLFQLKMQVYKKMTREAEGGISQVFDKDEVSSFVNTFPFKLTQAQEKVLRHILKDMASPFRMNRLLQGDVGSGKTAVAAISIYATVTAGKQCAFMVPTEILAEQHYLSLMNLFEDRARIVLLTGSVKGKPRKEIETAINAHDVDIVIGTHALIQDNVHFSDLGLVIVDEQHRFGVNQRRTLRDKGMNPDVLFMTATPIPRTLAITAFGDMDVSIIDELPSGRKPVETHWATERQFPRVLSFIEKHVTNGEQAYVVCPLIEESDKLDIQNAVDLHHQMETFFPGNIQVGLLHGRLPTDEKEQMMKDFSANRIQVLVSTTVIEVGVNVPNATIMVIYDAERFGLSQLHQLRGRVGRGNNQSYCILIADPKGEVGKERMRIMTTTTDGFELAEQDLKLRGPGDFFGTKQSGMPEFKVADMVHDYRALETARADASEIIQNNSLETDPNYASLAEEIKRESAFKEKMD
ncbi:DNA helicase [Lentibacillus sp. JNUCC-1]|uniref:ATP-dependent DNA helicase RecG n=1 Tax=Lentibacillus sp. JNUCC-1 TaxID=2654513 RepID=UPI0012E78FC0|nr:ATP-dependent DNA helicase RecG [Lentibacillus sp. JNUCC-1]MUV40003.1 DNA helicase [Lentibacillus sp. JNUCC-1]